MKRKGNGENVQLLCPPRDQILAAQLLMCRYETTHSLTDWLTDPRYTYRRQRTTTDDGRPRELLQLNVVDDGVRLYVDMFTGVLTVSGQFVYDWFTIKFRHLLENVDAAFARDWVFVPTPAAADTRPLPSRDDQTGRQNDILSGNYHSVLSCNLMLPTLCIGLYLFICLFISMNTVTSQLDKA